MKHVSRFRLSIASLSMLVAISSSQWLVAQEQPTDEPLKAQPAETKKKTEAKKPIRLPRSVVKRMANEIVPAIKAGNDIAFLNSAMPVIRNIKREALGALDELSRQHDVEPIMSKFLNLVLQRAEQGHAPSQVVADFKLARVAFDGLASKLDAFAKLTSNHPVMEDPLQVPAGFKESEDLFWNLHVLENEFGNVTRSIPLGRAILSRHEKKLKRLGEFEQLDADLTIVEALLSENHDRITERAAALRLQRFERAHDVLVNDEDADFEAKLTSAMELEQDGSVLISFLETNQEELTIETLTVEGLTTKVETMLEDGREAAGDVAAKANLFRNGLHYWTRGRFGEGTQVFGLVKDRSAIQSEEAMEALYMPRERELPVSTYHSEEESSPGFERRHYYTWAAEYRPIIGRTGGSLNTDEVSNSSTSGPARQSSSERFL